MPVYTTEKVGPERIILTVYADNNLPRVEQKVGLGLSLHYTFWGPDQS